MSGAPVRPWKVPSVLALGLVSFFSDVASEMVAPLLPLFLVGTLGAGPAALGVVEGAADATASFLKLVSGALSDRLRSRKGLVVAGYAIAACARPLVALAATPLHVVGIRSLDRVGKGLRTSPRDALLAEAVPLESRSEAFGFHRAMDHAGAVVGPLVALVLLTACAADLRTVFALAAIPGAVSLVVLAWKVKEDRRAPRSGSPAPILAPPEPGEWRLLLPMALFTLAATSDLFVVLRAQQAIGVEDSLVALPLLWVGLHVVKSASSLVCGRLADRVGAQRAMSAGFALFALVYAGLAWSEAPALVLALALLHGVHTGLVEGPERALVAAFAPERRRGAAFGRYHLVTGLLALPAGALFGGLWQLHGHASAFAAAASVAALAALCVVLLPPRPPAVQKA